MLKVCSYCNNSISEDEVKWALEIKLDGYFCDHCEYYHYFSKTKRRPYYKLFLERSTNKNDKRILNKPEVKLSKRLSPLRYPGGKTRLIDFMYHEVTQANKRRLYSPFAGGASIELAMLDAGVVEHITLNDLDKHLMNFYDVVFYQTKELIRLIKDNPLTIELYEAAHDVVLSDFESTEDLPSVLKAFYYLINNRCSFSGIYKAGRMGGKNGGIDKLSSRWNPTNMIKRIERLGELSDKVTLTNMSYQNFIEENAWDDDGVFVIDPPYVEKAEDIYRHAFGLEEHRTLFIYLSSFWHSYPNCDFYVFYDEHPYLYGLSIPEDVEVLARKFSIAN